MVLREEGATKTIYIGNENKLRYIDVSDSANPGSVQIREKNLAEDVNLNQINDMKLSVDKTQLIILQSFTHILKVRISDWASTTHQP